MIKKIIAFVLPIFCIIALMLKLSGVDHIEFGEDYYRFMSSVLQRSEKFVFAIPDIPEIPSVGNGFIDALSGLVNGLTSFINIISLMLNTLIKVVAFILGMIQAGIDGIGELINNNLCALVGSVENSFLQFCYI